jgi:dipeptidyl aminopeptidase/acylaminoacyl peptidase
MNTKLVATTAALMSLCVSSRAGAQRAPLSVEAALAQPSFQLYSLMSLSPDARWVAYTLQIPNHANRATVDSRFTSTGVPSTATGARVRITELKTGRTLKVGEDAATTWGAAWSPDGRYLAFYSDADGVARLWVRETATGRTRRVSQAIVRAFGAAQYARWAPDSRHVVMPILPYGSPLPEAPRTPARMALDSARRRDSATVRVLRADPALPYGGQGKSGSKETDIREALHADLAYVDIATGRVTTLATGYWPLEFKVSANGRFVAFSSEHPPTMRPKWTVPYDLMVVALGGQKPEAPRAIVRGAAIANYDRGVFWSPTSATLVYSASDSAERVRFYAADSSDWTPREVAIAGAADLGTEPIASSARTFWWDESGRFFHVLGRKAIATVSMPDGLVRSVARVPAGTEVLALLEHRSIEAAGSGGGQYVIGAYRNDSTKRMGFARIDLASGGWRVLREENGHFGNRRHVANDVARDGRVVYRSEDAQHPADLWLASADFSTARRITRMAPELEGIAFGETKLIDFNTPSGPRRATLLLPAGYRQGVRYPLVVYPYPTDRRSDDLNVFGTVGTGVENMQLLATRGFAVLAPDVAPLVQSDQMRELAAIIMPGVDRVIELGIADSMRLGLMGHSWGGYTTIALIAQTTRFGAAVMRGGLGDWVAMTGALQTTGFAYGLQVSELLLESTLRDQPEIYQKNSPIYQLDRVRTPLLIVHGEGETTVPIFMADQVFAGLQRLGRKVEFARYAHENHTEFLWSYPNQRDYASRMLGWFETHLKGERDARNVSAPGGR